MRIKNLCAACLVVLGIAATANAQTENEKTVTYPQLFFGLQGGAQTTFTNFNNWKLITPTASFSFGSFFTPVIGARLHFNGLWNKGGYNRAIGDYKYDYKYLTSNLDLMVNLVTLFGKKNYYPLNVYLIGGIGLNYAWDNDDAYDHRDKLLLAYEKNQFSHNARVGAQLDYNINKHFSVNLEVAANSLNDRYNSKLSNKDDWQLTAQIGVAYKFAAKKKKVVVEPEVWETRQDTIWYDDAVFTPKVEDGKATWNVFYKIRESDFEADEQLKAIGEFLKDHRECKVDIKSYADVQTGNPKINMEYSKQRCEKAVKALTDAGVPASSITSSYYGDTVQPFAENDKNRVSIIVATGLKDVNIKTMEKKFRTKEVRYRVK
ncbi:MAG: outer membrane beta-barrel protein [Bacteroidaceae bacterium]|nr:outer membrane beta-barrel protein [Bacteroidaceae bacterium]